MLHTLALPLIIYTPFVLAAVLAPSHGTLLARGSRSCEFGSGGHAKACQAIATSWYAGWHGADFPPSSVSWDKYSSVRYAFACVANIVRFNLHPADYRFKCRSTTPSASVIYLEDSDKKLLPQFVKTAHKNVCISAILGAMRFSENGYFLARSCNSVYRRLDRLPVFFYCNGISS
jgi:chitinase